MRSRFAPTLLVRTLGVFAAAILLPAAAGADDAGPQITVDHNGLRARTADGQFAFKVGGRLHADGTLHIGDTPANTPGTNRGITDGTEVRRARLIAQMQAYEDWAWVGEVDFADNGDQGLHPRLQRHQGSHCRSATRSSPTASRSR
ncbi:MAG: hypothetical protein R3E53_11580 [Myxococcota bacterium]